MDEEEHEIYVGYIPDENEMEPDSATHDSAAAKNLGEMKKRLKDLEDEVVALREMVAKADKEMSAAAQDASMEDGCEGASPSLPDDVLTEILVRLPVKSLVRFKTVSKSWRALISSPNFVNQHTNHDHKQTVLVQSFIPLNPDDKDDVRGDFALFLNDPDSSDFRRLSVIPFIEPCGEFGGHSLVVLGPCNGLIFILQHNHALMLCNPALREFNVLPPRAVLSFHSRYDILPGYGFGFDQVTGSYKVVCIYKCRLKYSLGSSFSKVELYDSRSNSWRFIDSTHEMLPHARAGPEIFFKGACHWYAEPHCFRGVVLCFDVSTESFHHFEFPEFNDARPCGELSLLMDRLALVRHLGLRRPPSCIEIWVMEEYGVKESWAQALKIEIHSRIGRVSLFWKDERALVGARSVDKDGEPAFLDLRNGELTRAFTLPGVPYSWNAIVFKESLLGLDQVIHANARMDKPWWRFSFRDCHISS